MSTIPRHLPRFLPTLTEVVEPSTLHTIPPATHPDFEAMTQSVMQRLDGVLEHRVREQTDAMLRSLVTEQLQTFQLRLREELKLVVQQAVAEALALREDAH